jgi:hypothetical protein
MDSSLYVGGSDRAGTCIKKKLGTKRVKLLSIQHSAGGAGGGASCRGTAQLCQHISHTRGRREGALGRDTEVLISLQRQPALTDLSAGGAAGRDALLALSLTKARFAGRDSMKAAGGEEDMIAVLY